MQSPIVIQTSCIYYIVKEGSIKILFQSYYIRKISLFNSKIEKPAAETQRV